MKWTRSELLNAPNSTVTFDDDITFDPKSFVNNKRLKGLEDVHVSGEGYFNVNENRFIADMDVDGIMICPCAITGEEVRVPFESSYHEIFSFIETQEDDVHVVKNEIIELIPVVYQLIDLDVPLQVIKDGDINYPKGDGWKVVSESDYEKSKADHIDPRLAKLKDFKMTDD